MIHFIVSFENFDTQVVNVIFRNDIKSRTFIILHSKDKKQNDMLSQQNFRTNKPKNKKF